MSDADDDRKLFEDAVRDARPLRHAPRVISHRRPAPRAAFRRADELAVLDDSLVLDPVDLGVESGEELVFRHAQVADAVLKRLRRGHYAVGDELDLHGLTATQAREEVRAFIARATARQLSCVRIVHGKGRGSGPRGPVLKKSVNLWLRKNDAVLAFASARPADGGTGALYVLLRR